MGTGDDEDDEPKDVNFFPRMKFKTRQDNKEIMMKI